MSAVGTPASVLAFSAHAPEYTALRRRLVPRYDAFYGSAVDALSVSGVVPERILDLGAGTGLLTAWVSEAFGDARFDLLDGSAEMLAEARERLAAVVDSVFVQDMAGGDLPAGPYDAVISALAIHHLEDSDKRALFGRVFSVLGPGGVFVNAEQVAGPTAALADLYRERWAAEAAAQGATPAEIADARVRRSHDRCADVESQLRWLREAGFATADCTYKYWESATLVAVKGDLI